MRLRKNMKRTAAAVLALSMAVSAVAAPASAAYICDVSQGNVVVSVDKSGNKTIKVGDDSVTIKTDGTKETTGNGIKEDGDGTENIVITGDNTGDNTKPTESLNAAEENTSEVEKSGENTSEVEKSGETKTEGKDKTQNSAAEGEDEGDEPTSQELLAPEDEEKKDEEKKDEQKPAETQETEQDKKTEKTSNQVIEYGQYDPEAQQEAAKPAAKQETGEKKAAEEKTYGDTNAPISFTEKAQEAARNVVKIINKSAKELNVILRNLKVDAGDKVNERGWGQNAVTVSGDGDVTLELEGKNELIGGSGREYGGDGISSSGGNGKLTIQGEEGSSLSATGGSSTYDSDESSIVSGGEGISAGGVLELVNATVTATGGASSGRASGGSGMAASGGLNIKNSKLTAKGGGQLNPGEDTSTGGGIGLGVNGGKLIVGEGSEVIAIGGDVKTVNREAQGGTGINLVFSESCEVQKGGKLTAIGGNAESKSGVVTGGDALWGAKGGIVSSGETTLIGGNAKSGSGKATGGNASFYDGDSNQVTVKGGTTTALGGKAESDTNTAVNGSSIKTSRNGKIGLSVETGGTLVTAMPGERDGKGNGIIGNVEIKTDGGKIEEVENAKVVKKEDGSITVTGDLVGIKQDGHSYELTATVEPTCTTPGKRVYTCTTEGHTNDTYEKTIDALGHHFTAVEVVAPTYTSEGYTIYKCETCGETEKRDVVPMLVPESNGGSSAVTLTVTGAGAYETSIADGRYVIAVPAETAVLSGCLSNLKELKAQGVNTIVFRTQLRETALNIDSMLSLGVDDTLFTLTHSGESAELTVGGFAHNELLH